MKYLLIILLLLSSIANGGTIDPRVGDKKYVEYGQKHECVVKIAGSYGENKNFAASAVVFKPRWILTAAHVVKNAQNCIIVKDGVPIKIDFIAIHSDYVEDNAGKYDIAIGYLAEDCKLDFYPELYENNDEVGKVCSMSGYGITGSFYGSERFSDGQKRAGSNIIASTDRDLLICNLTDQRTQLEFLICHGDSGGGLFIDKKLAGINSCLMAENQRLDGSIGEESGHTRISLFIDWINKAMVAIENSSKVFHENTLK